MISSIIGFTIDCKDANTLADFYANLLGLEKVSFGNEWAIVKTKQSIDLIFQAVEEYIAPVWPWEDGKQQQMAHIDFKVDDLSTAVELAVTCGAAIASKQYYETATVMLDPEGHPFCLSTVH